MNMNWTKLQNGIALAGWNKLTPARLGITIFAQRGGGGEFEHPWTPKCPVRKGLLLTSHCRPADRSNSPR